MRKPSRIPLIAGAAMLVSAGLMMEAGVDRYKRSKTIPPIPSDVLEKGGDVLADWMTENGFELETVQKVVADKANRVVRAADLNSFLPKLQEEYESLPDRAIDAEAVNVGGDLKPNWETVAVKLTPDVLANVSKLENPKIYGINGKGELVIGDGGIPFFTARQNYYQARNAALAQNLSLMTYQEYFTAYSAGLVRVGRGWGKSWYESGESPVNADCGTWNDSSSPDESYSLDTYADRKNPTASSRELGAERVVRVQL